MKKILQELKVAERKESFLKEFLVWVLQQQNEKIKINDAEEVAVYNIVIEKILADIKLIGTVINELKRDAHLVR
jgi:hypothetical protein